MLSCCSGPVCVVLCCVVLCCVVLCFVVLCYWVVCCYSPCNHSILPWLCLPGFACQGRQHRRRCTEEGTGRRRGGGGGMLLGGVMRGPLQPQHTAFYSDFKGDNKGEEVGREGREGGRGHTLPSPRPRMTFPRVSRLLLMALPSVCLSLLSPSSLAAKVLRSLPARSTKFRVDTCHRNYSFDGISNWQRSQL